MGDVGLPLRWYSSEDGDVVWELEALVKLLSRDDQSCTKNLEDVLRAWRRVQSRQKLNRGEDCNYNNYWFTSSNSSNNTEALTPQQRADNKKMNTFSGRDEDMLRNELFALPGSGTALARRVYGGNNTREDNSSLSLNWKEVAALFGEERSPVSDPNHVVTGCRKSVSCPNLLHDRMDSFENYEHSLNKIQGCSLQCLHFGNTAEEEICEARCQPDNYGEQCPVETLSSGIASAVSYKLASAAENLDQLVTESSPPVCVDYRLSSHLVDNSEPCTLKLKGDGPRNMPPVTNDNWNNSDESENTNSSKSKPSNCNTGVKTRSGDRCDVEVRENQVHDDSLEARLSEQRESPSLFYGDVLTLPKGHPFKIEGPDAPVLADMEVNWNALKEVSDIEEIKKTSPKIYESDMKITRPKRASYNRSFSPSSNIREIRNPRNEDALKKAPSTLVSEDFEKSASSASSRKQSKKASRWKLPRCFHSLAEQIRNLFIDDSEIYITQPLKRVTNLGVDLDTRAGKYTQGAQVSESKALDMSEFLEPLKYDISIKHEDELPNPIEKMQQHLGLEQSILPPSHLPAPKVIVPKVSDDKPLVAAAPSTLGYLKGLILRPVNWILASLTFKKDQGDTDDSGAQVQAQDIKTRDTKLYRLINAKYFLTGFNAYKYYRLLTMTESKYTLNKLKIERAFLLRKYRWKQEMLITIVKIARDYYSDPTEVNLKRWKTLKNDLSSKHESDTDVRVHIYKIPDHLPFFTLGLTLIVVLLVLAIIFGMEQRGLETIRKLRQDVPTFLGTEVFSSLREPNPWIGPPLDAYRVAGAVIPSCMRLDKCVESWTAREGYRPMIEDNRGYFGCCEMGSHFDRAGTTTFTECMEMTEGIGVWKMGVLCSERLPTENSITHLIRPCCTGYHGGCKMRSHEHCLFLGGSINVDCDHCVQVNCFKKLCKLREDALPVEDNEQFPWLPGVGTHWQQWRFFTAIPMTFGAIHFLVLLLVQVMMMVPLEMCIGWHRLMILYTISSIPGQMMACIFQPHVPVVGSTSGTAAVIGVALLELFQAWKFLRRPWWELGKLLTLIILFAFMGTLPHVSIVAFFTGLVVGMIGCLMIVPYITFGRRLWRFRIPLVVLGLVLLIITYVFIGYHFYFTQYFKYCLSCIKSECVAYTGRMCETYRKTACEQIEMY